MDTQSPDGRMTGVAERPEVMVAVTDLQAGALRLPEVLMQSVTMIAPAIAALFFTPFVVSFAGVASPLAYPIAFVISLMLGIVLVQYARKMPSAGGYYTYISRSIHPYVGWIVAWLYILYGPTVGGIVSLYMGNILQQTIKANWGNDWPWLPWVFMLAVVLLVGALQYRGISISGRTIVALGLIEMGIVVLLAIWALAEPGKGGLNLEPYNPGKLPSLSGFALATVFGVQAFTGWDGAAPLAEESENPERNIPRGVIGSILILGVYLILVTWAIIIGWGTANISSLPTSSELPAIVVAKRVWGDLWWVILWALLSSTIAVSLACANTGTRMWFAMARSGSFPKPLARVHPVYRTPVNAIYLQTAVNLVTGFGLLWWLGAVNGYGYESLALALSVITVFVIANVGVFMLYRRQYPNEFNVWVHAVFPAVSTVVLVWLLYKQLSPFPPDPLKWAVPTVIAWIVLGVVILAVMHARGQSDWVVKAGQAAAEQPESAEQLAHRPAF